MPIYKMGDEKGKDGKQKYRVRINYQDSEGKNRQIDRVTYGHKEAKDLEEQLRNEIKSKSPGKSITFQMLFTEYIQVKHYEARESSVKKSESILSFHILPDFKNTKIDKLTLPMLQKWKLKMESKTTQGHPLSLITKQNAFGEFRALLNYAVKMEYIPKNLLSKIGNFKSSYETKKEMLYYTKEEFLKFIKEARKHAAESENSSNTIQEWHYYVFFATAFYTGLRKGEIYGLTWEDVQDGYLSVKRSIAQKMKGDDRVTPPKNKTSYRTLQIPTPLIKILNEHYNRCKTFRGFSEASQICGIHKAIRDGTVDKRNRTFASLAELKKIRIHDYRHSHASLLANEGINIQEIARRLGHSKIEITWNTYSHLYPREEEKAIAILNEIV